MGVCRLSGGYKKMKELYNAPELEIITFVPVEELAAG